jgi:hypothetical protein
MRWLLDSQTFVRPGSVGQMAQRGRIGQERRYQEAFLLGNAHKYPIAEHMHGHRNRGSVTESQESKCLRSSLLPHAGQFSTCSA